MVIMHMWGMTKHIKVVCQLQVSCFQWLLCNLPTKLKYVDHHCIYEAYSNHIGVHFGTNMQPL